MAGAGLPDVGRWVRHLHERVGGTGYPDGLVGAEIPFESRLLAVADALEAMTSDRPYRAALPLEAALDELEGGAGSQFDEKLVAVAVELAREGRLPLGEAAALAC